ncbi:hypothetical protein MPK74_gp281 [Erwinia phage pEa_SNUABM_7]|uniref:Uncharacterized protein n=1 Tax=Erwinia phage pEa_SNUABM_7 TaxID=2866695 RepID=A0AAE7WT82_9CAUD|nr:hypothetical protein MPK74_gp281 [Erwinia phage pEa_SNUABM_7]QYW04949.1 hypothetical protein pEaSNUABM7_00281 [Erwinia phage pEa_SNUABM_7]
MQEIEIHGEVEIADLIDSESVTKAIERFQQNPTEHNRVRMIVAISEHAYDEMGITVDICGNSDSEEENHDAQLHSNPASNL